MTEPVAVTSPDVSLRTAYIGPVYMKILSGKLSGHRYVCQGVYYNMGIDHIPTIQVSICVGNVIRPKKAEKYTISDDIMALAAEFYASDYDSGSESLIECAFYDQLPGPEMEGDDMSLSPNYISYPFDANIDDEDAHGVCIFKGYILNLSYTVEESQQVSITCGWPAYKLSQLMDYRNASATASELIYRIRDNKPIHPDAAEAKEGFSSKSNSFYITAIASIDKNTSVVKRIAICSSIAKKMRSFERADAKKIQPDSNVLDVFYGNTRLNSELIGDIADLLFNEMVARALLSKGSALSNILGLLSSRDVMLSVIPKVKCGEKDYFKLVICPDAHNMKNEAEIELTSNHILGISGTVEGVELVPIPDVMFLTVPQATNFSRTIPKNSDTIGRLTSIFGVASRVADLEQRLQKAAQTVSTGTASGDGDKKEYTTIVSSAPEWLADAAYALFGQAPKVMPKTTKEASASNDSLNTANDTERTNYINAINAMAMHTYRKTYLSNSSVTIKLRPDLRFGYGDLPRLEDKLGATVKVHALTYKGKSLILYGRLVSIQYSLSRASSSLVSYSITLDCVRLDGTPELRAIPSPIYVDD